MNRSQQRQVGVVLVCHFTAAFAALGMPPFFGIILSESLGVKATYLVGWFYIVPTICTALAAPWWGSLADRWGKKPSLLRAQLGLALGFLLAGWATDAWWFMFALMVQGALGGTMAASNAYLATIVKGEQLAKALTLMQGSARAAMVAAPLMFGIAVSQVAALELYRYMALLPLVAALLLYWIPNRPAQRQTASNVPDAPCDQTTQSTESSRFRHEHSVSHASPTPPAGTITLPQLYGLRFSFAWVTVVTFPYFVPFAQQALQPLSIALAGFLFSLPHLVYLLAASAITRSTSSMVPRYGLGVGFFVLMVSLVGQALTSSLPGMIIWRVVMGVAMTLCFVMLHRLMSDVIQTKRAGRAFGSMDSAAKWAGVAAGLIAGAITPFFSLASPLWGAALVSLLTAVYLTGAALKRAPLATYIKE